MSSDKTIILIAAVLLLSFSVSAEDFDEEQLIGVSDPLVSIDTWTEGGDFHDTSEEETNDELYLSPDYTVDVDWVTEATLLSEADIIEIGPEEKYVFVAESGETNAYTIEIDTGNIVSSDGHPEASVGIYSASPGFSEGEFFIAHDEENENVYTLIDGVNNEVVHRSETTTAGDDDQNAIGRGHEHPIVFVSDSGNFRKYHADSNDWDHQQRNGFLGTSHITHIEADSQGNFVYAAVTSDRLYRFDVEDIEQDTVCEYLDNNIPGFSVIPITIDETNSYVFFNSYINEINCNTVEDLDGEMDFYTGDILSTGHTFTTGFYTDEIWASADNGFDLPISSFNDEYDMNYGRRLQTSSDTVVGRDSDNPNQIRSQYLDFPSSSSWQSQVYSYDEPYEWEEIELSGLTRRGDSAVEVTVETSNDGFDTVEESDTLFDSEIEDGTETYPLFLGEAAEDIRFEIEFSDGGSEDVAFVDYLEFRGDSAFDPPVLQGKEWNVSNPEFGDTVSLLAEVEDPDGEGIDDTRFSGQKDSESVFTDVAGEQINSTHWKSDPIELDCVECSVEVTVDESTDAQGNTAIFDESLSIYVENTAPEIQDAEIQIDQENNVEELVFGLEYFELPNLDTWSGDGLEEEFTNSTLKVDIDTPIDSLYEVTDFEEDSSGSYDVNFDYNIHGLQERAAFSHTISEQRVERDVELSNTAQNPISYKYIFSSEPGEKVRESVEGILDVDDSSTETGIWEVDEITQLSHDVVPGSGVDEVVLDENYTAVNTAEFENTGDVEFTGVLGDDSMDAEEQCFFTDSVTTMDLPAGETVSEEFGFDCVPGTEGDPFIQTFEEDDNRDRVWYNTTDMQIFSDVTTSTDITWSIPQDDLPDSWGEREAGSAEAYFNSVQENVSLTVRSDRVDLTCEVGCGNSSLSEGEHTAALTYTHYEDDDGGTVGAGPSDPDQGVEFSSTEFGVPSGRVAFNEFEISNLMEEDNEVTIELTEAQDCQYFDVRESLENTSYGDKGVYNVPDASAGLEPASTSVFPGIRVEMPEPEERGFRDTITCPVEVDAEHGTSPDLRFEAVEDETFTTEFLVFVEQTVGVDLSRERSYTYCQDVGLMLSGVDDVERECAPEDLREIGATNGQLITGIALFLAGITAFVRYRRN